MIPSVTQWDTPSGTLAADGQGGFSAMVRTNLRGDPAVKQAVDAIVRLTGPLFIRCGDTRREESGYVLPWPANATTRQSLESLAPSWRKQPADHVADAISVALCVSRAIGELQHLAPLRFLLSPVQMVLETGGDRRTRWAVLLLPAEAVEFKDLAAASPALTAWLSGGDLLRRGVFDRAYVMAAVLYYSLVGDLYPPGMSHMQRLRRQLAFRPGNPTLLRTALDAAVPDSLSLAREKLEAFIATALGPGIGRPMTAAQAVTALQRLSGEVSAPLLAGAWESAGNSERALRILESDACMAAPEDIAWPTLERLRQRSGRQTPWGGPTPPRDPPRPAASSRAEPAIARIRSAVAAGAAGHEALAAMLTAMLQEEPGRLDEHERLFVGYANGRWLGAAATALQILSPPCTISWNRAVRAVLMARLHTGMHAWAQVSRDCRDCLGVIDSMPDRGSERGGYAAAFALLLDAGAHVAFVAAGHSPDYLQAAWQKLTRARTFVQRLEAPTLHEATDRQVVALRRLLRRVDAPHKLKAEVDAVCGGTVVVAATDDDAGAAVPWPDDHWLFGA